MMTRITKRGFTFKYNRDCDLYECRGNTIRDDYGDEIPEPKIMAAAEKVKEELLKNGHTEAGVGYSEKGWVEVHCNK